MTKFDNTNRGALFKNEKKQENNPDMKGSINVEGKEYWLSGWGKTSQKGDRFLSLSVKPKEEKKSVYNEEDSTNDDLPF